MVTTPISAVVQALISARPLPGWALVLVGVAVNMPLSLEAHAQLPSVANVAISPSALRTQVATVHDGEAAAKSTSPSSTANTALSPSHAAPMPKVGRSAGLSPSGYVQRALSLQAAFVASDHVKNPTFAGSVAENGLAWLSAGALSARYDDELRIGGDARGVAFALGLSAAIGGRLRFGPTHGPVARIGIRGSVRRDAGVYLSGLRLPVAELGYQITQPGRVFDLVAHAAPWLTGHLRAPDGRSHLRGAGVGASVGMRVEQMYVHGDWSALVQRPGEIAVSDAQTRLCMLLHKGPPRARRRTGDPRRPLLEGKSAADFRYSFCAFSRVLIFEPLSALTKGAHIEVSTGLSFAVGVHSSLDPAP